MGFFGQKKLECGFFPYVLIIFYSENLVFLLSGCKTTELLHYLVEHLINLEKLDDVAAVLALSEEDLPDVLDVVKEVNPSMVRQLKHKHALNVANGADDLLESQVTKSKWANFIHDLQAQSYDKTMFEHVECEDDDFVAEISFFKNKLELACFKDRGLPLDQNLTQLPLELMKIQLHKQSSIKDDVANVDNGIDLHKLPSPMKDVADVTIFNDGIDQHMQIGVKDVTIFNGSFEKSSQDLSEEVQDAIIDKLGTLSSNLMEKNQHFLAYKALKLAEWPLVCHEKVGKLITSFHEGLTHELLTKILTDPRSDLPFALSFLGGQCKSKSGLKALVLQKNSR